MYIYIHKSVLYRCIQVNIDGKNVLSFATWSNTEHTGGEITIHVCVVVFLTSALESSEKFKTDGLRVTENERLLDRSISVERVTLVE